MVIIFSKLPFDNILYILSYCNNVVIKKNKIIFINKFNKNDFRYNVIKSKTNIFKMSHNSYGVVLGKYKRLVLGVRNKYLNNWEYFFHIFTYDLIMRCMNDNPILSLYNELK